MCRYHIECICVALQQYNKTPAIIIIIIIRIEVIKIMVDTKFFCPLLDISVSGSPIIQNGKLIGAVTHVLVNDPTMGYGIFVENMLEAAA